jgi:competence ComEA-like helix-hairpin-helix protein
MLTRSEKTYLALTLAFLAAGSGIKAWRQATVKLGPFPDPETLAQDSAHSVDSLASSDSLAQAAPAIGPGDTASVPQAAEAGTATAFAPDEGRRQAGAGTGKSSRPTGPADKINLNRADAADLMRVKGVGAKTAAAILAWRRAHGPFRDLRDLLNIKGIGEKKLEKLGPYIIL